MIVSLNWRNELMNSKDNRAKVLANDNDIVRQVPLILEDHLGIEKPQWLRDQELFYRATDYRGS
jgi:hypothetical protein